MRRALLCAVELFCFLALVPLAAAFAPDFAFRRGLLFVGCVYALFRLRGKVEWRRLLARPSVARAVEEGRPYRGYFPLGAPDRD